MYFVYRYCNGQIVYWNSENKGWYVKKDCATKYANVEAANTASEIAECTITVEIVNNISFKKM